MKYITPPGGGGAPLLTDSSRFLFFLSPFKSTKQEEGNVPTSTLTGYQFVFFPFPPLGGRDASHFLCLSLPPSVRPSVGRSRWLRSACRWRQRAKKRMRTTIKMASSTPMAHHCLRPENAQIFRLDADGGGHELNDTRPLRLRLFSRDD